MPGFNNPGSDYGRDDTNSLRRIAEALEIIAENMEEKVKERHPELDESQVKEIS